MCSVGGGEKGGKKKGRSLRGEGGKEIGNILTFYLTIGRKKKIWKREGLEPPYFNLFRKKKEGGGRVEVPGGGLITVFHVKRQKN